MKDFTYETEDKRETLETFEWDNVWIDHANDSVHARVLYIGDSISCGTRRIATEASGNEIYFDGFGTSKSIDNSYFRDSVSLFAAQLPKVEKIVFNNGLHGWHLEDSEEYGAHYDAMIKYLIERFENVPIFIALTTYVKDAERLKRVKVRNKVAVKIAEKHNLPVIDTYSVTEENMNLLCSDGVHFVKEGYEILAKTILEALK